MGGPGASVLLREPLTVRQRTDLNTWVQSITSKPHERDSSVYQFWLKEEVFSEPVSRCLFSFSIEGTPLHLAEGEEREQVIAQLGYLPQQAIGFSSGCNDAIDHHTLGLLILHVAETYDGLIDMEGAIQPPLPPISTDFWQAERTKAPQRKAFLQTRLKEIEASLPPGKTMADLFRYRHSDPSSPLKALDAEMVEKFGPFPTIRRPPFEDISAFVHSMPGQVYEIYYETASNGRWVFHIVDATFLSAWMKHPHFYMVK